MEGLVLASTTTWSLEEPSVEVPSRLAMQSIVYSESVSSIVATVQTAVPFEKSALYPGLFAWNASYWIWWVLVRCS